MIESYKKKTIMKKLNSKIIKIKQIDNLLLQNMFELMNQTYDGTSLEKIEKDLSNKDYILLLTDKQQNLQGFTTMQIFDFQLKSKPVTVIYSGDTVISKDFLGELELMQSWWQFVCEIQQKNHTIDIYWMLISKGWRTYKFLPVFFNEFYPNKNEQTPAEFQDFIDNLGIFKFPEEYKNGLVCPHHPDYLKNGENDVPSHRKNDADIQFFLTKNPNFYKGDELVCTTKLHYNNLTNTGLRFLHKQS